MSTLLQPLSAATRDTTLDILRGFAIAGVLFMLCVSDIGTAPEYSNSLKDDIISWPKYILVEGRMYTMLILIFGIGFHVQFKKASLQGESIVPPFLRRLAGLMLIGFIHAIILSKRDILMFYALTGLALLPVRNLTNRKLLYVILFVLVLLVTPVLDLFIPNPWFQTQSLVQPNNYPDHVIYNWDFFKIYHRVYPIYIDMLFHFLLGFWIGRTSLLKKIKTQKKLRRTLLVCSVAGSAVLIPLFYFLIPEVLPRLTANIKLPWQKFLVATAYRTIYQLWMLVSVMLYVTIIVSLSLKYKSTHLHKSFASFGQMALSNYLIQSLIIVPYLLVFDKYNDMPPFNGLILFLVVLAIEIVFSNWWLSRFTMGPFEWILRSITYWKWQPLKKDLSITEQLKSFSIQN